MVPQLPRPDDRVPCTACERGYTVGNPDRVCSFCDGEMLLTPLQGAELELVSAENEQRAAAQFSDAWWQRATKRVERARAEVARLEAAECEAAKAAGEMRGAA